MKNKKVFQLDNFNGKARVIQYTQEANGREKKRVMEL